jgi:D-glycero-alpha-D-manno-heptose-7-phosphate kinase
MIISKTPLRISFLGGGTDLPIFIKNHNFGCVISTTINKFIYVSIKEHGDLFYENYRLNYSDTEVVNKIDEIKNNIIRETLKFFKIKKKLYISTIADIPSNSGLGSSSAFCVGLINILYNFVGEKTNKLKLANEAFAIEKDIVGKNIGYQDHFSAAYGGLNFIKFYEKKFTFQRINNNKIIKPIFNHLISFNLNMYRNANDILKDQVNNYNKNKINLEKIKEITLLGFKDLKNDKINEFFKKIDKSWSEKRKLSNKISNKIFDNAYKTCLKYGAFGGKISGAGGGGFMNIFANKNKQNKIIEKMKILNFEHIPINYYKDGTKITKF